MDIMSKVDLLDLIKVNVFLDMEVLSKENPLPYRVSISPLDESKRFIIDDDALKTLNQKITEKVQQFENGRDPRVVGYIKEFASRMISELSRNGLALLEDIPEAAEDHYAKLRNLGR